MIVVQGMLRISQRENTAVVVDWNDCISIIFCRFFIVVSTVLYENSLIFV